MMQTADESPDSRRQEDHRWCQQILAGDEVAAEYLLERHGPRLHATMAQLAAGNPELAGELTQEAWAHACARLSHYDGSCQFFTWLYRVARNRAIDLLRRRNPTATDPTVLSAGRPARSQADQLELAERHQLVHAALADLADDHREIILLRDFQDMDYADISDALSIASGTVKSRLSRARAALRDAVIARAGGEEGL